ncbi:MAG: type II secretion system F family protein [Eubacterium sp.]|nr:type II secretion system F family protein [Eubacterium sp.]
MGNLILCIVGTIWTAGWLALYFSSGAKYQPYIDSLEANDYFMKSMYGVGYRVIDLFQVNIDTPYFRKKMGKLGEMYGKKSARLLVLSDLAAQITYLITLIPFGIFLAVMMEEPLILMIVAIFAVFLAVYIEYDKGSKVDKRREEILKDFPHLLSQLALLINAGMPLREALETASKKEGGILYEQLRVLADDMRNGIPEYEAFSEFADRCGVDEVRKLSGLILQNVRKGSAELAASLLELSGEIWRNRTSQVREQGEKASSKLLIPILIIFGGILMMVVAPMFKGLNF